MIPVCVACNVEYWVQSAAVALETMSTVGPTMIFPADLYECPSCHHRLVFPKREPLVTRFGDGFHHIEASYSSRGKLIRGWKSTQERDRAMEAEGVSQ